MRFKLASPPRVVLQATALVCLLFLASCLGGTGTDTENGVAMTVRVVDLQNRPMSNLRIRIYPVLADPFTKSRPALQKGFDSLWTDSLGFVRFVTNRRGTFIAEARRAESTFVLDTLPAFQADTIVFTVEPLQRMKGTLRLFSGFKVDTGMVFVRGSGIQSNVFRGGEFDLGYMPPSAQKMTLGTRYSARHAYDVYVRMTNTAGALVVDSRFVMDSSLTPNEGASVTLFKASESAVNICLENPGVALIPGISIRGSLRNGLDVIKAVGWACEGRFGARIQADSTDLTGKSLRKLATFLLPDTLAWLSMPQGGLGTGHTGMPEVKWSWVVPISCVIPGEEATFRTYLKPGSNQFQLEVDDLFETSECHR